MFELLASLDGVERVIIDPAPFFARFRVTEAAVAARTAALEPEAARLSAWMAGEGLLPEEATIGALTIATTVRLPDGTLLYPQVADLLAEGRRPVAGEPVEGGRVEVLFVRATGGADSP